MEIPPELLTKPRNKKSVEYAMEMALLEVFTDPDQLIMKKSKNQ